MNVLLRLECGMADILLVAEGSILLLSTFLRWPRKGRWALE